MAVMFLLLTFSRLQDEVTMFAAQKKTRVVLLGPKVASSLVIRIHKSIHRVSEKYHGYEIL
jgi:hypothetical protein